MNNVAFAHPVDTAASAQKVLVVDIERSRYLVTVYLDALKIFADFSRHCQFCVRQLSSQRLGNPVRNTIFHFLHFE
jgi:hypothetical protein